MVPKSFRLETERLLIRELQPDDLDFVAEMLAHPEVMRHWPRPLSRQEAREWIERHRKRYEEHGFGYWLSVRKDDSQPVGQVGLLRQEFAGLTEVGLGYMLHRSYWGHGYAFEGARECLRYGFEELALDKILVLIRPENEESLALAHRLGAQLTGNTEYAGFIHEVFEIIPR